MFVEMVGIGFFGYMVGTFQSLIQGFKQKDLSAEQQELIDLWLIQLDKARKSVILYKSIFNQVKEYYSLKFKYDTKKVHECIFFEQLKPRLQNLVFDSVFKNFKTQFQMIFEDIDPGFQRALFKECNFRFFGPVNDGDDEFEEEESQLSFLKDQDLPVLESAGHLSQSFNLIISGQIHIMNKSGMYDYGVIQEGSYFGDISILLNEPSDYSYMYNPYSNKPILMLSITSDKFLKLCE